ncbi:MAG: nucleotide exchange factor GrpE [Chitinophagales bacterium]
MEDKKHQVPEEQNDVNSVEDFSQQELNKIDNDASDVKDEGMNEKDGNDLMSKLGFSKKNSRRNALEGEEKLREENEDLKQQLSEVNDKNLRLFAEFDNFRKRNLKERLELIKTAGSEVIISLLPVLDDFQRALKQMEATDDPMTEGVKLIYQKLLTILESKGLKAMKSVDGTFNSELHEAITEIAVQDEDMSGKIVDEIESGYYLNDKIIRHAKVVVGK